MLIGNKEFDVWNNTYIMGILNVTPDSFSDGGDFNNIEAAINHTEKMIEEGASIIDVGGESTRPGYTLISDEEEISRVVPVIKAIKERFDTVVSIDTYKSGVAKAAIEAGADMVNDIWGLKYDPKMAKVVAKEDVCVCIMHNRDNTDYGDFMPDVLADLKESIDIAKKAGIKDERIIVDPGVGFGKTYENNLEVINKVEQLKQFGYPVLLATSRKSVIAKTYETKTPKDRVEGTLVTTVMGVEKGCSFVRVHDVFANNRAIIMTKAVLNS
ncbi:Dihydropteroate synthase [Acetitomaculum ruminis DSM 5522]|uniref:Dihydropteroate synthase n=1 Tax=Acetitomaculum ruminis DSM 5522 TaxID=1120918 RepID=A0A1I0XVT3_9FIRM|nr:dihydropteroate synthase [Acetitomaculum ruminis]SFB04073.1 Dihydropteroate synthase [Acetitomaculum ruminis DSM 5522]